MTDTIKHTFLALLSAATVKRHNVCKRHDFLDTGFKQSFSPGYSKGTNKKWNCF